MRLRRAPHRWDVTPARAVALQRELAGLPEPTWLADALVSRASRGADGR